MNAFTRTAALVFLAALPLSACSGGDSSNNAATVGGPSAVQAGAPDAGGAGGGRRVRFGQILEQLNLSDDQKTKIRAIIAQAREENKNVTDRDTKRANMRAAYAKVQELLTPAQRDELKAKMQAARAAAQQPATAATP